jgi:peptidoglycan/xylan/chitin deacetylase (PgdA/CDA1 family)
MRKSNRPIWSGFTLNHLIKLLISVIVASGDHLLRLLLGRHLPECCVVINYHSIPDESRARFARQLDLLLRLAKPIPVGKELVLEKRQHYVAVTVDDVFRSFVVNGLSELCQRKIPVTLFAPTGYLGRKSSWADHGGENKVGEEVASADNLRQIAKSSMVDFGSHSVTHQDLPPLSEAQARDELRKSKESLEAIVGREVVAFSFPYGSYGERELRLAREAGYRFCFDSTPETVFSAFKAGLIGQVDVQPTDSNLEFRLKVLGAYRWVRRASAWKRKFRRRFAGAVRVGEPVHG